MTVVLENSLFLFYQDPNLGSRGNTCEERTSEPIKLDTRNKRKKRVNIKILLKVIYCVALAALNESTINSKKAVLIIQRLVFVPWSPLLTRVI